MASSDVVELSEDFRRISASWNRDDIDRHRAGLEELKALLEKLWQVPTTEAHDLRCRVRGLLAQGDDSGSPELR